MPDSDPGRGKRAMAAEITCQVITFPNKKTHNRLTPTAKGARQR